ncbi:MAG TPA: leucine-rich repeat domain-containing protein [Clostridia bacterium]|nr:leucine-rich repeat domain-containing protein [Clostridia bacterium]
MLNKLKIVLLMLLSVILVSAGFSKGPAYSKETPEAVFFGSKSVEAEVRKIIDKPAGEIYTSDVKGITSITLTSVKDPMKSGQFIDLTGLELLPELTGLSINIMDDCTIQNIEVLRRLPKLTAISMQQLQPTYYTLKSLNLFSNMKSLRELSLANFRGVDISGLQEFPHLEKLSLSYCDIKDITPLSGLSSLKELNLTGNAIEDIGPLQGLGTITALYLEDNMIKDYSPIFSNYENYVSKDFLLGKIDSGEIIKKNITYEDKVIFNNKETEAMLRVLLGKHTGYLTQEELDSIKALEMSVYFTLNPNEYVYSYDLQDFSKLTNLESLSIQFSKRTDYTNLDALGKLTKLTKLSISPYSEGLKDITPLSTLTNLKEFDVTYIPSEANLNALAKLTRLERLNWLGEDLKPLLDFKDLKELTVLGDSSDFSILNRLPQLEILHIQGYTAQNIASLKSCTSIKSLDFYHMPLSDISFLGSMTGLEKLQIFHGGLKSIRPLGMLRNLKELDLGENEISDITPLAQLKKLEVLNLSRNKISKLDTLKSLLKLKELKLGGNPIRDISALSRLKALESLELYDNYNISLKPLEGLTAMKELSIFRCGISDISSLSAMTRLETLDIDSNGITDISPLAGMTQMKRLSASGNKIEDITALKDMKQLIGLGICYNKINDIAPLRGINGLEYLDIRFNNITDADPVLKATRLEELSLDGNPIRDYISLMAFKNTTSTYITGMNKPGYVFGNAVKTDTAAYWNGNPIHCIKIGESYAVSLEDLNHCGYDASWQKMSWDDKARWRINSNSAKPIKTIEVGINPAENGKPLGKAMYGINIGIWDNREITVVGVGSNAYVMADELVEFGFDVVFDEDRNVLNISQWNK